MPEEKKSSTADFLNEITEKPEPFKEEPVEKPEEEEVEEVAGEEKPLPFHKDPKVQRYIQKEIEKRAKEFAPSAESQFRKEVEEDIKLPPSFIKLVGNDTEEKKQVLKDLSDYFGTLKGEAKQEFIEQMQEQERQQTAEDDAALDELNSGFEAIEEDYGVDLTSDLKTRNSFIEFLRKVSHKDENGEVDQFADIPSAWEAFQEQKKPAPASRAKELASRGMARSTDTGEAPKRGYSWKDVDREFSKLEAK